MDEKTLQQRFPRASKDFLEANRSDPTPQPKPPVRHEPMAAAKRKKAHPRRRILRIISYRTRICDTDNLCPKYFIDALRYARIITDDSPEHIELQVTQEKVGRLLDEKTVILLEL